MINNNLFEGLEQEDLARLIHPELHVDEFKSKFSKNLGTSQKKSDQVIDEIDKAIKALENTKKALQETYLYLNKADSDLDDLISITLPTNRPKEING